MFIAVKGAWEVFWQATTSAVTLQRGDIVRIGVYRGFRNATADLGAIRIAVVGDPGKVDWHPSVIASARKTGLSVDHDGNLIVRDAAE